jgi:polar amino acid transport system substrate-binding protein
MKYLKFPLLVLLVLFTDSRAYSDNKAPSKSIKTPDSLVWGFSIYPPFKFKTEDGVRNGIDLYILKEVTKKLGIKLAIVDCPFNRCLKYIESGKIDVMTSLALREERKKFISYVNPPYYTKHTKSFYMRKDSNVKIEKYEDIYKYSIGVKSAVRYFEQFDLDNKIKKEAVGTVELNLTKLIEGRIDALINTTIQLDYLIIKNGYSDKFRKSKFSYQKGEDFIGMSKKSKFISIKHKIDKIVKEMIASGEVDQIVAKFFSDFKISRR